MIKLLWPHCAVFSITLIVDIFWARYTTATADRRAVAAGIWSMAIVLGGTLSLQFWLANHWVLLDSAAGAFVGTYGAVRWGKK